MLTTLRFCYFKGLRTRDEAVNGIKSVLRGFGQSVQSFKATWQESSIFAKSPLDAIAAQELFEIERNFLKINGFEYPPLRPLQPPPGHVRVEFYAGSQTSQLYQAKYDCWADAPLLSSGQLDLHLVTDLFFLDANHLAIIDPVRWKPVPFSKVGRLSSLALHNLTYNGQLPLRVTEVDLPALTVAKRRFRHYTLIFVYMLKAIFELFHLRAYDEYEFSYPLPPLFLWLYGYTRAIHPATRREYDAPDLDVLNSPTGGSLVDLPAIPAKADAYEKPSQIARLFSGPTYSQMWCATIVGYAMFLWLVAAEVVACAKT